MSVGVEHFSYMTRPYQTRAENCYPTQLPRRWKWEPTPAVTKSRIMGLPDCQNSFKIGLTVSTVTQPRRVLDRHVHRRTYTLRLFVWRLSVAYIVPKSRTERPRKTKMNAGIFVPKTVRSLEHSFPWWNFHSRDHSFPGTLVPETEYYAENSFPWLQP